MRFAFLILFGLPTVCLNGQSLVDIEKIEWIHGAADCSKNVDPPVQVVQYDNSTWIFRQNKCDHYESPFIYLFLGRDEAMLIDTGAKSANESFPLYETVERIISARAKQQEHALQLKVIHSHSHGDHKAGDYQFRKKANVELIGPTRDSIVLFLKISHWPEEQIVYDLGHRKLTIIPIPGHDQASIAIYDEQTRWFLTGDTVYPGRLYVRDWPAYKSSILRLQQFCEKNAVSWLMGTHIEMSTTKGVDYPVGTKFHPAEHKLPMEPGVLLELSQACLKMGEHPVKEVHNDFIIEPVN